MYLQHGLSKKVNKLVGELGPHLRNIVRQIYDNVTTS